MRNGGKPHYQIMMLAFMLATAQCIAQENAGMVVSSRGEVSIISNSESHQLKPGEFIFEHDEITVSNRSFAVLQLVDGAKLTLRPESSLIIEQYLYGSSGEDAATLSLVSGSLKVIAGAIASSLPENFRIRTPLGLMSAQGTEISLSLCDEKICEQQGLVEIPE